MSTGGTALNRVNKPQAANPATLYNFSTGLTLTLPNTVTANISTGILGGQTAYGGTAAAENLTLSSTTNAAKGLIKFGASSYYNEANGQALFYSPNLQAGDASPFQIGQSYVTIGNKNSLDPSFVEFARSSAIVPGTFNQARGSVGYLGSTEVNMSNNMLYLNNVHTYYDNTLPMIWSYMGYTNGWGLQWVKAGHPYTPDPYVAFGQVIYGIDILPDSFTGEAVRFGSRVNTQRLNLVDTLPVNPDVEMSVTGTVMTFTNLGEMQVPNLRVYRGGGVFADPAAVATFQTTGNKTTAIWVNQDAAAGNYNVQEFLKNKAGSYNLGAGTKIVEFSHNTIAFNGSRATATVFGGFSNVEYYWDTTNSAGVTASAMVLSQDGALSLPQGGITVQDTKIMKSTAGFANGAAAAGGTLLNAPAAGNPTKWIPIDDNGTTRYIPAW